jgi:hypothetical protein
MPDPALLVAWRSAGLAVAEVILLLLRLASAKKALTSGAGAGDGGDLPNLLQQVSAARPAL